MKIETQTVEETVELGRRLGRFAPRSGVTCVGLDGPLGVGKTQLARGIAEGAGVEDPGLVSSPTYVLMNIYKGPVTVWHLDAYRIASADDFAAIGIEDLLNGSEGPGIVVIEWASMVEEILPGDCLRILIEHEEEGRRSLAMTAGGAVSTSLLERLLGG